MPNLLHFEDFPVGRKFECGPYTVTKDEIFAFAREFDPQPHHLNEEAAQKSLLKGLSASGFHVCAMAMRMFADGLISKTANRGGVGAREVRWIKPVRPGDVLRLDIEVVEATPSRGKPVGYVTFDCRVLNQQEQVALVSMTPIVGKRS